MANEDNFLELSTQDELRQILADNPDLPVVFWADNGSALDVYDCTHLSEISVKIGEILNTRQDVDEDQVFIDRDGFYDLIAGSVDSEGESDRICEEYEPYWTKCILVKGYN